MLSDGNDQRTLLIPNRDKGFTFFGLRRMLVMCLCLSVMVMWGFFIFGIAKVKSVTPTPGPRVDYPSKKNPILVMNDKSQASPPKDLNGSSWTHYLKQTLDSLLRLRGISNLDVFVSQDGFDVPTANEARRHNVQLLQRDRIPDPRSLNGASQSGTAYLAQHCTSMFLTNYF